ncbi:MAG: hypothetical protein A2Y33_01175 [Spirochaetes bacterium GWF1_51_8]|nr:MAG: hypothetical protein A2Y33_01175 [Spirochaetes bacterium GWF1_51_8]
MKKLFLLISLFAAFASCALFYPQFFVEDAIDKRGDTNWSVNPPVNPFWELVGPRGFSMGTVSYVKLDFDTVSGVPYVAFRDTSNMGAVSVMRYDGTNWVYVGAPGFSGGDSRYLDFFIDGSTPYVAFQDMTNGGMLSVMRYTAGNWEYLTNAGISVRAARDISLFVSGGNVYAAFADQDELYGLSVYQFNGTVWSDLTTEAVTAEAVSGVSLWVDGGVPYAAFQDSEYFNSATVMRYLGPPASNGWLSMGFRGFSDGPVSGPVLAFNSGTPYVAFQDLANGSRATVMKFTGLTWTPLGLEGFTQDVAAFIDFAFDNNTPYIVFEDWDMALRATLKKYQPSGVVTTNSGTGAITTNDGWVSVGGAGFSAGAATFLSLDFYNNIPYVAFVDGSTAGSNKLTVMRLK